MNTDATRKQSGLRADAERNRELILDAANDLFAERGLGVTMDEIAARAGVGVGTVYRRFPDREQLIDALFEQKIGVMVSFADEGLEFESGWDGLAHLLERASVLHFENRAMRELIFGHDRGREWISRGRALIKPRVSKLVERAKAQGTLRADVVALDVPLIQMMIVAVMDYTADAKPDVWRRQLQIVLDGLRADRTEPTPLPVEALDAEQLATAMTNWKIGRR